MRLIVCETGEQAVWVWVLRAALVLDGSACGGGVGEVDVANMG